MRGGRLTTQHEVFAELFSPAAFTSIFDERFARARSKGIDRLSGAQFAGRSAVELSVATVKVRERSFRFSPYLEVLKLKGRDKPPRLVGIPTVRDRVVLHQLNEFLKTIFPESVPAHIASGYVRQIATDIGTCSPSLTCVFSGDIRNFYDSIPRSRLLHILSRKIEVPAALDLVRRALATPIVTKHSTRASRTAGQPKDRGVPQGLSISNLLAAMYLHDLDEAMPRAFNVRYFRYVDDILMYGAQDAVDAARVSLRARLRRRGLSLHPPGSGKSHFEPLTRPFGYLGYLFAVPTITVRASTVERLLQSLASLFSDFSHNKERRLAKLQYLTPERLKEIFMMELNDRITGAIRESRRYGWIAYFGQINDETLLHRLDSSVTAMFERLPEFNRRPPPGLKRFARALFEMRHRPAAGYIRNYDIFETPAQMLYFLSQRGRVDPSEQLSDDQITARFQNYVMRQLSEMHADEGVIY
ncbi:RNA-directed DNA polymerase [Paraburkholderia sp. GAS333]